MTTEVITTIGALRQRFALPRLPRQTLALVPVAGELHDGHVRIIEAARSRAEAVAVGFLEPPCGNPENDLRLCREAGAGFVFSPSIRDSQSGALLIELVQILRPDLVCVSENDAGLQADIRRGVRDLDLPATIVAVPTLREADGLAVSSGNWRLRPEERLVAPMLYRALRLVAAEIFRGAPSPEAACAKAREFLAAEPRIRLESLELLNPDEMTPVTELRQPVLIAISAWLGSVRLTDCFPAPDFR